MFDNRSTIHHLRDSLIIEHSFVSILLKKSLKDPLFIRVLKLEFGLSMQFAINAMLYTDDYIDKRQKSENVAMF
jgi:hypothetical protein